MKIFKGSGGKLADWWNNVKGKVGTAWDRLVDMIAGPSKAMLDSSSSAANVDSSYQAPEVDPGSPVVNPDGSAGFNEDTLDTSNDTPKDYGFGEYLEGLFASQGAENEANRVYNSAEAALNRQFQSHEAQIQRDWYEAMSNSAYQRSVADMKKAGINPILAYQNGGAASSGTGIPAGSAAAYTATGGDRLSDILVGVADVVSAVSGASASKIDKAFKIFRMMGG